MLYYHRTHLDGMKKTELQDDNSQFTGVGTDMKPAIIAVYVFIR